MTFAVSKFICQLPFFMSKECEQKVPSYTSVPRRLTNVSCFPTREGSGVVFFPPSCCTGDGSQGLVQLGQMLFSELPTTLARPWGVPGIEVC